MKDLRSFLGLLAGCGELREVGQTVDPRVMPPLWAAGEHALLFSNIVGYPGVHAVGQVLSNRERCVLAMGAESRRVAWQFLQAVREPVPPEIVPWGPVLENSYQGAAVDLTMFPLPLLHQGDGGPYISAAVTISEDPVEGRNAGCYRMMYRTPDTTGFALVSTGDMARRTAPDCHRRWGSPVRHLGRGLFGPHRDRRTWHRWRPQGRAGAFGPPAANRYGRAGLRGDSHGGRATPYGLDRAGRPLWGVPERVQGAVYKHPLARIKAIYHRDAPIFQVVTHPWEGGWAIGSIPKEANCLEILTAARVETTAVHVTKGGCGLHVVASIRKKPGQGKLALLALLALPNVKRAVVVDERRRCVRSCGSGVGHSDQGAGRPRLDRHPG
ncbi:MAG: UbiD family decarboxylase [Candidatus Methylomirabilota bacterium]|jgi:3-polyprenyl-4-hydroxybenzoate decarboxylase